MANRLLIKGGRVLTMDPALGNFEQADVLVEGETIVAVGRNLEADDCEVVDAGGQIVIPGFVDTHRHVWEAVIRNVGPDWTLPTYLHHLYFNGLGGTLRPEDVYIGNLLGALEALDAGVTTLLDWSMVNSPEHADEMVRGLQEAGIRAVFAYGTPLRGAGAYWSRDSLLKQQDDAIRVKKQYFSSWESTLYDMNLAQELDAICTMHVGFGSWGSVDRSIEKMTQAGLLNPSVNLVHVNSISDEEYKMIAD